MITRDPTLFRAEPTRATRIAAPLLALACAGLFSLAASAQETLRLDRSNGSYAGLVWFVSSAPDAPAGDLFAGVAIGRLPEAPAEQSFALWQSADGPELGVPGAAPAELARPGRSVIVVAVDFKAHDEVRHLIARWSEGEQSEAAPPVRIENLLDRVAATIGLETPYRSVLRGSEPIAYLRDLARVNASDR
jgi:hypothetical protein